MSIIQRFITVYQLYHCIKINEGKIALDSIRHEKFDLILLDLAVPEFSDLDVINSLKEEAILESNNVVIFTAS